MIRPLLLDEDVEAGVHGEGVVPVRPLLGPDVEEASDALLDVGGDEPPRVVGQLHHVPPRTDVPGAPYHLAQVRHILPLCSVLCFIAHDVYPETT